MGTLVGIGEPTIASILAILVLGERINVDAGTVVGVAVAIAAVVSGVTLIDSSPKVQRAQHDISTNLAANNRKISLCVKG